MNFRGAAKDDYLPAAEAVRHALGAAAGDLSVRLILLDGGVLLAKKGQDDAGTGFTNPEDALKDCLDMGIPVYAERDALKSWMVPDVDMVEGVQVVGVREVADVMKEARTTMIF